MIIEVKGTSNSVSVETTETTVEVETVDVISTYYPVAPGQLLPEHEEVGP